MAVEAFESPSKSRKDAVDPPRLTVLQAVQRNLFLAVFPIVVLVALASAIAVARHPTYSSDAQLNVGGVNLTTQSIPGYALATQQLATAYSRAVYASSVVSRVSRRTGLPPTEVIKHVTAAAVEQTPIVRIHGKASSASQAQQIANETAQGLVAYAASLQRSNPDTDRLLRRYLEDARRARVASQKVRNSSGDARRRAQTQFDLANLQQHTDALLYQASLAGDTATGLVRQLAPASPAKSDRRSVLQRLLLAGVLAGALIGIGLAVARGQQQNLRRLGRA